ncbi:transcription termination factor MTERF8, chloroplastic-like [Actinidia eriantha]|uniref:transcription termination factor MTERF8, chloroplastic-like n=1 Tax=Actinidia eriantha TaxID=165200 RepID=UPI0025840567|nr:transcription termination factor MTERF8, chloroplastic-like [Actinidia eriantha]XP_057503627.1 transcription termination factor MTERF8, chloroplastic-like [Actinidia eriantha]
MAMYMCRRLISLSVKNPNQTHISPSSLSSFLFSSSSRQDPITVSDYLLRRHKFYPETVSKLSKLSSLVKNPESSDSVLSFFDESGFSMTQIEQVIKRNPCILSSKVDRTIKPKIKIFQDLGLSPTDIADIISADPWILMRSTNHLGLSLLTLKSVLGSVLGMSKVLRLAARVLGHDLEKTMIPNIEFIKSCGFSLSQTVEYVYRFPTMFLQKPEDVKELVRRVDEMGFNRESKMFIYAIRAVSTMTLKNWERKLEVFRCLGFSDDDIASVFRRAPSVLALSERKIKESTQILLDKGKSDISFVIHNPVLLALSVENRIKPRLRILEVLERKKLLPKKPSLATVCKISDKNFFEKFVLPYSNEVGKIYIPKKMKKATEICDAG